MTTYTARTPLDLIALVPYLIGFHPEDSVVLLTFGAGEPFHARVDLPDNVAEQEEVGDMLREVCGQHAVPTAVVLVYSDDAEASATMAELLITGLTCDGVDVVDALRVEDAEYFDCVDTTLPGTRYDLSTHPFTASRVYDGKVAHDNRGALADTLVGTDEDDRQAVEQAAARFAERALAAHGLDSIRDADGHWMQEQARWLHRMLEEALTSDHTPTPTEAGRLSVLTALAPLRDLVWFTLERDNAVAHVALWRDLVRRAPEDLLPAPAALLGLAAWQAGDGALAWCAVDRCTTVDPDHALAEVVGDLLTRAVPPSAWPQLRADLAGHREAG